MTDDHTLTPLDYPWPYSKPRKQSAPAYIPRTGDDPVLSLKLSDLDLSMRAFNPLKNGGFETVGQVVAASEDELLRVPNFGRKSLNEIKELLAGLGVRLTHKPRAQKDLELALGQLNRLEEEVIRRIRQIRRDVLIALSDLPRDAP